MSDNGVESASCLGVNNPCDASAIHHSKAVGEDVRAIERVREREWGLEGDRERGGEREKEREGGRERGEASPFSSRPRLQTVYLKTNTKHCVQPSPDVFIVSKGADVAIQLHRLTAGFHFNGKLSGKLRPPCIIELTDISNNIDFTDQQHTLSSQQLQDTIHASSNEAFLPARCSNGNCSGRQLHSPLTQTPVTFFGYRYNYFFYHYYQESF